MSAQAASPPQDTGLTRRLLGIALAASFVGTAVLGAPLYFGLAHSMWWIAVASAVALLAAGFYLGRSTGEPEPLFGSVLAFFYFAAASVILMVGTWIGKVPDPMPGLATGDSTFFFVWPLLMLVAGVVGTIVGGRAVVRSAQKS
jgi:hypothetical protein